MPLAPPPPHAKLSAVVVSCDRAATIDTCLAALGFADEVLLVDKSSTDGTAERGLALADRVIRVPHSPTVEDTRGFAVAQAAHEWILLLDDDECLDPAAVRFIAAELAAPRAEVYALPLRHYILGPHDPRAYYWPEWHPRLFRRGAVRLTGTVHRGIDTAAARVWQVPPETGAVIHHLSHRSVFEWIAKTNRYTSRPDRARVGVAEADLAAFAHAAIERWRPAAEAEADGMPAALGLLRASYDIIDRLKTFEEERGLDGEAAFAGMRARLAADYAGLADLARPHRAMAIEGEPAPIAAPAPPEAARRDAADASIRAALREEAAGARAALAAARREAGAERDRLTALLDAAGAAREAMAAAWEAADGRARDAAAALHAMRASTCWRATAPLRRLAGLVAGGGARRGGAGDTRQGPAALAGKMGERRPASSAPALPSLSSSSWTLPSSP